LNDLECVQIISRYSSWQQKEWKGSDFDNQSILYYNCSGTNFKLTQIVGDK
jgi:hypothetical protein